MNIWCDSIHKFGKKYEYGKNYYGLPHAKVVIGVVPSKTESDSYHDQGIAVYRYFAKIVAKDPDMETGSDCHIDACLLRITETFENDVVGDGEGCGNQPSHPFRGINKTLQSLDLSESAEVNDDVIILGYGQGYKDILPPNATINRCVDYFPGRVTAVAAKTCDLSRTRFHPREEIAVICPTVGGHSGGPCVNMRGQVIGIVSRVDPRDKLKCYLSPTSEWKYLVDQAKTT